MCVCLAVSLAVQTPVSVYLMSLGARYLMKEQSGMVLGVGGKKRRGKTGQLCGVRLKRSVRERKCKMHENWIKPRRKCADCNPSEYGKWDMRDRVREAAFYHLSGAEGHMEECEDKGIGQS